MTIKDLQKVKSFALALALISLILLVFGGCEEDGEGPTGETTTSAWTIVEPQLEGNHLRAASFANEDVGWCVALSGIIIKTEDGGSTWTRLSSITNADIWDVHVYDTDTAWAVGNAGKLMRTTDGGATWDDQLFDVTDESMHGVTFASARKGLAVGSGTTLLHSADGGRSWDSASVPGPETLYDVDLLGEFGVAVGEDGTILVGDDYSRLVERFQTDTLDTDTAFIFDTTLVIDDDVDPPETTVVIDTFINEITYNTDTLWYEVDTVWNAWTEYATGLSEDFFGVSVGAAGTAWAVGEGGTILKTTDAGVAWSAQTSGVTGDLLSVNATSASAAWISGAGGTLLSTTDGGATWTPFNSGTDQDLYDVAMVGTSGVLAVGDLTMLYSGNSGSSWQRWASGTIPTPSLLDLAFVSADEAFVVGYAGAILHTSDAGDNWVYLRRNVELQESEWFTTLQFSDDQTGWCGGEFGVFQNGYLLTTTDGADSWTSTFFDGDQQPEAGNINDFQFVTADTGYAVSGTQGFRTIDGGITWIALPTDAAIDLYALHFVSSEIGWIVGQGGTILATTDAGLTWTSQNFEDLPYNIFDVQFLDATTGWIAGAIGNVWHTTDGGLNWTAQGAGVNVGLNRIHMRDASIGWIVGFGGTVLYTGNGGVSWSVQPTPNNANLNSIWSLDANDVWIVGENGLVMHTTTGGN